MRAAPGRGHQPHSRTTRLSPPHAAQDLHHQRLRKLRAPLRGSRGAVLLHSLHTHVQLRRLLLQLRMPTAHRRSLLRQPRVHLLARTRVRADGVCVLLCRVGLLCQCCQLRPQRFRRRVERVHHSARGVCCSATWPPLLCAPTQQTLVHPRSVCGDVAVRGGSMYTHPHVYKRPPPPALPPLHPRTISPPT